jgi:predicted RNase H-like HicB family nuclease
MVRYKAGYKFIDGAVHAQVLDFPAVISCGQDLDEARRMLASALIDLAETRFKLGQSLPWPDPPASDPEMDMQEPIRLEIAI